MNKYWKVTEQLQPKLKHCWPKTKRKKKGGNICTASCPMDRRRRYVLGAWVGLHVTIPESFSTLYSVKIKTYPKLENLPAIPFF
jgi:hypothetical protein